VVREKGKAAYRCLNKSCFTIQRRVLEHFVSKPAFDMEGLGPKIIDKFIEEGIIKDASDLFTLKESDIADLERFAEKSAQNIIKTIQTHKKIELPRFIYALGIPNVGEETAYDMADAINQKLKIKKHALRQNDILKILKEQKIEDWQEISDIGPIVAQSIYDYFNDKHNLDFIEKLFKNGVEIKLLVSISDKKLAGKSFVFTGGLDTITRDEAKEKVRDLGGNISESVSKETDYVVVGTDPGSKYDNAKKLGVKILNENQFLELIK
jgi:DNA ligase (NAD+)